jgi:hypothetical protein
MYPSTACRSPRLPGAWIDATGSRSPRVSLQPKNGVSQRRNDARSLKQEIRPRVSALLLPRRDAHAVVLCFSNTSTHTIETRQV